MNQNWVRSAIDRRRPCLLYRLSTSVLVHNGIFPRQRDGMELPSRPEGLLASLRGQERHPRFRMDDLPILDDRTSSSLRRAFDSVASDEEVEMVGQEEVVNPGRCRDCRHLPGRRRGACLQVSGDGRTGRGCRSWP